MRNDHDGVVGQVDSNQFLDHRLDDANNVDDGTVLKLKHIKDFFFYEETKSNMCINIERGPHNIKSIFIAMKEANILPKNLQNHFLKYGTVKLGIKKQLGTDQICLI